MYLDSATLWMIVTVVYGSVGKEKHPVAIQCLAALSLGFIKRWLASASMPPYKGNHNFK